MIYDSNLQESSQGGGIDAIVSNFQYYNFKYYEIWAYTIKQITPHKVFRSFLMYLLPFV